MVSLLWSHSSTSFTASYFLFSITFHCFPLLILPLPWYVPQGSHSVGGEHCPMHEAYFIIRGWLISFFWNAMKAQKTSSHLCPWRSTLSPTGALPRSCSGFNECWVGATSGWEWRRSFLMHLRFSLCGSVVSDITFIRLCLAFYNFWVKCWRTSSFWGVQNTNGRHPRPLMLFSVRPVMDHSPPQIPVGNVLSFAPELMWLLALCHTLFCSCRMENCSLPFLWFCVQMCER